MLRTHNRSVDLPGGHIYTSSTLVDLWLLGRLKHDRPNRSGTFPPLTDQQYTATSAELGIPWAMLPPARV